MQVPSPHGSCWKEKQEGLREGHIAAGGWGVPPSRASTPLAVLEFEFLEALYHV